METLKILNTQQYDEVVERMLLLEELPDAETNSELNMLAEAVEAYDSANTPEPAPTTLRDVLEAEMYKRRLKQRGLAELLEVHETRLSEMLRGKREMSLDVARKLYTVLKVPAETVLMLRG